MAIKDHNLDAPIIEAAFNEFMDKGYQNASMRKIAANAGVTIGAIYTRYPTKDDLFISLVKPLLEKISQAYLEIKADYGETINPDINAFKFAIKHEADTILHLLFDDYDRAKLLLCKSNGSSLANCFNVIVENKISETIKFFNSSNGISPDEDVLRLLISSEFSIYYQIIEKGYPLPQARKILDAINNYHFGGWLSLLNISN